MFGHESGFRRDQDNRVHAQTEEIPQPFEADTGRDQALAGFYSGANCAFEDKDNPITPFCRKAGNTREGRMVSSKDTSLVLEFSDQNKGRRRTASTEAIRI